MKIRALKNFAGVISMYTGQEMECDNEVVLHDLISCGYIEQVKEHRTSKAKTESGDMNESEPNTAE